MSYVKHTWVDNETISKEKLNNIEDGIEEAAQSGGGSGAIVLSSTPASSGDTVRGFSSGSVINDTIQNIYAYLKAGKPVYVKYEVDNSSGYTFGVFVAQIVGVYKYSDTIRVLVEMPRMYGTLSNEYNMYEPAVAIFYSGQMNGFPEFLRYVIPASVSTATS